MTRLIGLALLLLLSLPLHAAEPEPPLTLYLTGKERSEDVQRLVEPLSRTGRAIELRFADSGGATPPAGPSAAAASGDVAGMFWAGLRHGNEALGHLDGLGADWARAWDAAVNLTFGSALLSLVVVIGGAGLAGFVARAAMARMTRPRRPAFEHFSSRLVVKLAGLGHDLAGLAAYWAAGHALADLWVPAPDLVRSAAMALLTFPLLTGGYVALGRFLLLPCPGAPRLMPLPNAERHFRLLAGYGVIGPCVLLLIQLAQAVATDRLAAAGLFTIVGAAITLYKIAWFWSGRRDFTELWMMGGEAGAARRLGATLLPWVLIGSAIGIWAVGRIAAVAPDGQRWGNAAGLTQFLVVLTPILAAGAAALARDLLCPDSVLARQSPFVVALSKVIEPVAAGLVWIGGFILLGRLWSFFMLEIVSPGLLTVLLDALWIGATGLVGWIIWGFLNALFDLYAPKRGPSKPGEDDDHDTAIQSRLGSVLPMLRAFVLGAAMGLTILILLSRIGVDIGPLLAGFGIFGLALSFGSQALVRDIVSGIFFIADDAFRVGEYIDTGRLKGTVEKITLRSVQLRHQSGQVHTIPFGQIASVTNASRDWSTVKFNIRLERDVDVEQARKIIKKTGQAMLEDVEIGPEMILPLKLQGIAEVADSAFVLRLKFTAKPARASWIQREALKRVHAALRADGIEFATNAVVVRGGDPQLSAAAAAAQPPSTSATPSPI